MSHERADTYVVGLKVERPVTRQDTGSTRSVKCALLRARRRDCCHACGLARERPRGHTRAYGAQHTPSHAMSLKRADSPASIVTLTVEHTAHAADHHQRTRPELRALSCVWTQRCRTRGLARAAARNARPGARCPTVVRRRFRGRTHCHSCSRPPAAHGAGIGWNRALLRVLGRSVVARAASLESALSAAMHRRAHYISLHALCRERADTCVQNRTHGGHRAAECAQLSCAQARTIPHATSPSK